MGTTIVVAEFKGNELIGELIGDGSRYHKGELIGDGSRYHKYTRKFCAANSSLQSILSSSNASIGDIKFGKK